MFKVKHRVTGEILTVYGVTGDRFLIYHNDNFQYVDMWWFDLVIEDEPVEPESVNDTEVEVSAVSDSTPTGTLTQQTSISKSLSDIINGIKSGDINVVVGDSVSTCLNDGTRVEFVVTDNSDDWVRFETRDCLGKYVPMTKIEGYLSEVWEKLPDVLKSSIIPTERVHRDSEGKTYTITRKLFLPAASEIFEPDSCLGDKGLYTRLKWYGDLHNRVRALSSGGTADWYWTESPYASNSTHWCNVSRDGYAYNNTTSNTNIAAPVCFRIPKSH